MHNAFRRHQLLRRHRRPENHRHRGHPTRFGEPPPVHVVAVGCDISHAPDIVYADGLNLETAAVGIGLSCRLCDREDCRSRAFPPMAHRLTIDPQTTSASPYKFETKP